MGRRILQGIMFLSLFITLLFGIFILMGFLEPKAYTNSITEELNGQQSDMWALLTNIETLPDRREDVSHVEITGQNRYGLDQWTEFTTLGSQITFEAIEKVPESRYVVRMNKSDFGMEGKWAYELSPSDMPNYFNLTITEDSYVNNTMVRSMMRLTGRDANLKHEMSTLKEALKGVK